MSKGTIKEGEYHPAADMAMGYLQKLSPHKYVEVFASLALSGNRMAEICHETLQRLINGETVSDRYILGLAWMIKEFEDE